MSPEDLRRYAVYGMGLVGGAAIASWGVKHLFVVGLSDAERRTLVGFGAGVAAVSALAYLLDIDRRWWDAQVAAEAFWQEQKKQAEGETEEGRQP